MRAARKYNAAIAECYYDGAEVVLEVKETGKLAGKGNQPVERAQPDDVALVLHTSVSSPLYKLYFRASNRSVIDVVPSSATSA